MVLSPLLPWMQVAVLEVLLDNGQEHAWSRNRAYDVVIREFHEALGPEFDIGQPLMLFQRCRAPGAAPGACCRCAGGRSGPTV